MKEDQSTTVEWVHCNQCLRKTRHEIVAERRLEEQEHIEPGDVIDWATTYTMLECRGCGGVTLRRRLQSGALDIDETTYYPPPISRQIPRWQYELPNELRDLLKETYIALHAGSHRLAIMGTRSLVDLFMNSVLGDIGGFQQKLGKLVENGSLSKRNRDLLETALEAGHAVLHRGHNPKTDDVNVVFDIVENLLQTMVLKKKSEDLKKTTPKRRSSK